MSQNHHCVTVDTDPTGLKFMTVRKPEHVTVTITATGDVMVNVNESCVFLLLNPVNITVENTMAPANAIAGD